MAHGTPDYNITGGRVTTHRVTDLGELAVRLGSPVSHDRRGEVVWWDDFEDNTVRYDVALGGTGAAGARSTARAHSGTTSWLLTGGSDGTRNSKLVASEPPIVRSQIGLEIAFNLPGAIDAFDVLIAEYDGTSAHLGRLIWSDVANELRYTAADGVATTIAPGIDLPVNLPTWNILKLVADFDSHTYVRAILNALTYALPGIPFPQNADVRAPRVDFILALTSRAGSNDTCHIDDLIITQNEP